jgi:hypothetical protein
MTFAHAINPVYGWAHSSAYARESALPGHRQYRAE